MVTFVIFVGGIYHFVKRPFRAFLVNRSAVVGAALEEARAAREAAEAEAKTYRERIAKLDEEIANLKSEFTERGQQERDRLREVGQATAERIARDKNAAFLGLLTALSVGRIAASLSASFSASR